MIAAGVQNTGPLGTIQGVAPKAFLGNYKIFGSPGINDFTYDDVIEKASRTRWPTAWTWSRFPSTKAISRITARSMRARPFAEIHL